MMEISRKSNFRFKALVIGIIATILTSTCSTVFGFVLFDFKPADEPFINRKVTFTGETYWRSDGQPRKVSLFFKDQAVRKNYGANEEHCGIITLLGTGENKFYVAGEGWIKEKQIKTATRFITVEINKIANGLNLKVHVDGEYVDITSDNDAIVKFDKDKKTLVAQAAGSTRIKIHRGEGKEDLELLAVVIGDEKKENGLSLQLSIAENMMSADLVAQLQNARIDIWDQMFTVEPSGKATAGIAIKDGKITFTAGGEGALDLKINKQEVLKLDAKGDITVVADTSKLSGEVTANAEEKLTILQKLTIALKEHAHAEVDDKHVEADGEVTGYVNDKEVAEANGKISYTKGDTDPKGSAGVRIFGKEFSTGEKDIKIISGLKALMNKIR